MGIGGGLYLLRLILGLPLGYVAGLPLADVLGLIFVAIGACILIFDLGHPLRFVRALVNYRTSWISIGAICDFIFIIFGILVIAPHLEVNGSRPFQMLPWMSGTVLGDAFQIIAGVSAFVVMIYAGLVLSYCRSIPFWYTLLLPIQFLTSSFTSALAVAFITLPFVVSVGVGTKLLEFIGLFLLLVNIILTAAHLLTAKYSSVSTRSAKGSVDLLTLGRYSPHFLGGVIVLGLLVPLVGLSFAYFTQGLVETVILIIAGICIIIGGFFVRLSFLRVGIYGDITGARRLISLRAQK